MEEAEPGAAKSLSMPAALPNGVDGWCDAELLLTEGVGREPSADEKSRLIHGAE